MADIQTLARPYARAVFELARDAGQLRDWSQRLAALAEAVAQPSIAALVGHPAVSRPALAQLLIDLLKERLGKPGAGLVRVLADNGRLRLAADIAAQFERLKAEAESRVDVAITTAVAAPAAQQQALAAAIGKRLGREVQVQWSTDEALLAGAVVRAGDLVIDGSLRGELSKLKAALAV
ncbi:MAG TPA: F0F1 ATP synthase subunit delta [Nevskiaceae bacterium]|nr:F0F1 ATP synthase subunit delta [Nevskiaceae bacterium]